MDETEDRWYEWLVLPFALVVALLAAFVFTVAYLVKLPRIVYRLVRRKRRNSAALSHR